VSKTALVLVAMLIAVPFLAWKFEAPLSAEQWQLLKCVTWEMLAISAACFIIGELTRNYSQVDKIWSITPIIFVWTVTVQAGMDSRMVLMALVVTVWGIRLTYNFSRHGAYQWKFWGGAEDYRWAHVRKRPELQGPLRFGLFNLFFISLYQNALLLLITLPIVMVHGARNPLGWPDYLVAAVYIGLVLIETVADQQQRVFQNEKHRRIKAGEKLTEPYSRGFISSGLFALSRHPNYAAEQSIWVVFFLFSVVATGALNWTIAGCLLLILLFQGSSNLAETISSGKYPAYLDYQKRVPRFIPKLF
jgi:steroid 5-alpha reductase family enzyme